MGSESEGKWDIRIPMCLRFENYPDVLRFTHSFPITELLLSPVRIITSEHCLFGNQHQLAEFRTHFTTGYSGSHL